MDRPSPIVFSAYTHDCTGQCTYPIVSGAVSVDGSACNIGNKELVSGTMTQKDGHLRIDLDGSDLQVTLFEGGVYADGHFQVAGVASVADVEIVAVANGTGYSSDPTAGQAIEADLEASGWTRERQRRRGRLPRKRRRDRDVSCLQRRDAVRHGLLQREQHR